MLHHNLSENVSFQTFFLYTLIKISSKNQKNKGLSAPDFLLSFVEVRDKRADAQYVDGAA